MTWRDLIDEVRSGNYVSADSEGTDKNTVVQPTTSREDDSRDGISAVLSVSAGVEIDTAQTLLLPVYSLLGGPLVTDGLPKLTKGGCEVCGAEDATHFRRCRWCDAVRGREVAYEPGSVAERQFLSEFEAVASGLYADPADKASPLPPLPRRGVLAHPEPAPDRARECPRCHRTLYQDPDGYLTRGEPCFLCRRGIATTREAA